MEDKKDIKPLLEWAHSRGEAKIVDRVLLKLMPKILDSKMKISKEDIEKSSEYFVPEELYKHFVEITQQFVGEKFKQGDKDV